MKNAFFCCCLLAYLVACGQKNDSKTQSQTQNTPPNDEFLCIPYKKFGKILPNHTPQDLENMFGKENISVDSVFAEGSYVAMETVIFKEKSQEMRISWHEQEPPFTKIMVVSSSSPASPFHLVNGIKVGSSLENLVKANGGKHITFSGFGWDYGGSCCNGLSKEFDGVNFTLDTPDHVEELTEKESELVYGDQQVKSDVPALKKITPYIYELRVMLNEYKP